MTTVVAKTDTSLRGHLRPVLVHRAESHNLPAIGSLLHHPDVSIQGDVVAPDFGTSTTNQESILVALDLLQELSIDRPESLRHAHIFMVLKEIIAEILTDAYCGLQLVRSQTVSPGLNQRHKVGTE